MIRMLIVWGIGLSAIICSTSGQAAQATQDDIEAARAIVAARQIETNIPKHLSLAREVATHVKAENNEHYSAGKRSLLLPGDKGANGDYIVKTDCIGFVEQMLLRSYGRLPKPSTKKFAGRYSIVDWVDAVDNGEVFSKVQYVQDLKPGDFLMWKFLVKKDGQTTNGHIQIVDGVPEKMPTSRLKGFMQWRIWVVDDSGHPTNPADWRYDPAADNLDFGNNFDEKAPKTGVGSGFVYLYTDNAGVVEAVSYGFKKSGIYHQNKWHILMARP